MLCFPHWLILSGAVFVAIVIFVGLLVLLLLLVGAAKYVLEELF